MFELFIVKYKRGANFVIFLNKRKRIFAFFMKLARDFIENDKRIIFLPLEIKILCHITNSCIKLMLSKIRQLWLYDKFFFVLLVFLWWFYGASVCYLVFLVIIIMRINTYIQFFRIWKRLVAGFMCLQYLPSWCAMNLPTPRNFRHFCQNTPTLTLNISGTREPNRKIFSPKDASIFPLLGSMTSLKFSD